MIGDLFEDSGFWVDILAFQELDLPDVAAATFCDMLKRRKLHVFLGDCDGGQYRCAIISRLPGAPLCLHHGRLAGAVFELLCNGSFCRVSVVSCYGVAGNPAAAMQVVEHAVCELKKGQTARALLGDFNLEALEEPLIGSLSRGLAWNWDDGFQGASLLPGTRESGRRLDFALGCGRFFPQGVQQRCVFSDHAQVAYSLDLAAPVGHRPPSFVPLMTEVVDEPKWARCWRGDVFEEALANDDVDAAWTVLSDAAEAALAAPESSGHRRSAAWSPRLRAQPRSKVGKSMEAVGIVQLRWLWRRIVQLGHRPHDGCLRDKAGRQVLALLPAFPWLEELGYFEMERWSDWLAEHIEQEVTKQAGAAIAKWRDRLQESPAQVCAWIRKREAVYGGLERPGLGPKEVFKTKPIHPTKVVQMASENLMKRWGRDSTDSEAQVILRSVPAFSEEPLQVIFTGEELRRVAKSMANKAEGPDSWSCASWMLLPLEFWDAFAALWQKVFNSGCIPRRWREGRVVLIEKAAGGHRPLTILSAAWRVGARHVVQHLHAWVRRWATHRVMGGGLPARCQGCFRSNL